MIIPDHCWVLTGIFAFSAGCLEREISRVLERTYFHFVIVFLLVKKSLY